jgi:MoaA/NifB/PqqE/SkfB family radical SAM enzyme
MNGARDANRARWRDERGAGRLTLTARPPEIQVEATNRCRRSCPTCARNFYDRAANAPGDLSPAILDAIAPLFPTAETVLVGGYGEPLLAEIAFDILARAHQAGCRTVLVTGGGDLDNARVQKLANARLSEIVLSVDGASDETNLARREVDLAEVLANLRRLRELTPDVFAAFNFTLQRANLDELPALVDLAARENVAAVRVFHQKMYSVTQADHSVLAAPELAARVFGEAQEQAARANVALDLPPLAGARPCEQPYRMLAVRHDGLVQGCCSALFASNIPRVVLGRLPDDDPLALWNAPAIQDARRWTLGE